MTAKVTGSAALLVKESLPGMVWGKEEEVPTRIDRLQMPLIFCILPFYATLSVRERLAQARRKNAAAPLRWCAFPALKCTAGRGLTR